MSRGPSGAAWVLVPVVIALAGCAARTSPGPSPADPLRLSDRTEAGDAAFRASMRLVLEGLEADAAAQPDLALDLYERSLQVDPTNAYAYLAIARHRVAGPDPASALPFLEKARALLESQGTLTLGAEAHVSGLRGAALLATGQRDEGLILLERARTLAPDVWSDGWLDPEELR